MSFRLRKTRASRTEAKRESKLVEENKTISIPLHIRKVSGGNVRQGSIANSQAAMKRVFSIFSFSQDLRRNSDEYDEEVDALIFDDKSDKAETDSVLSDKSLTTFGDLDEQPTVGTMVKQHQEKIHWNKFIELKFETSATKFMYSLITEPQRKAYSQGNRSSSAVKVDTRGSNLRSSKLLVKLPSINNEKSNRSLLSVDELQLDVFEESTEILKLDLYSVISRADIGKIPSVILTDLLWSAFGLQTENEIKLSDAHIIVRFFFQLANEGNIPELCFQLLNTSRTGILSLKEVNEFVAHACTQALEALIRIPAAKKLFKRYLKSENQLDNLEFLLCLFPYVRSNSNQGLIEVDRAREIYKLYITTDAAFGIDVPEKIRKPVTDYFTEVDKGIEAYGMTFDVFYEAYSFVKNYLERNYLPRFIKKIKRSNRLGTKLFQSINASPVPGLEFLQFKKLLRVCPPLKEHCERCAVWMETLAKEFSPTNGKDDIQFNEICQHVFKRRIPI